MLRHHGLQVEKTKINTNENHASESVASWKIQVSSLFVLFRENCVLMFELVCKIGRHEMDMSTVIVYQGILAYLVSGTYSFTYMHSLLYKPYLRIVHRYI